MTDVKEQLKHLIINNCNKIGCTNCELKWPKDEDGNKCRQDYLMMLDAQDKNND